MGNKHNRVPIHRIDPVQPPGRDWVCGDIHGCFSLLEQQLEHNGFDPEKDRLFCVGDLIDRGPESVRALEFLDHPWFHAVLGNHERLLLESLEHQPGARSTWCDNGGSWFFEQVTDKAEEDRWHAEISSLPLLMEVPTSSGVVGIVHGRVPPGLGWRGFAEALEAGDWSAYGHATWGHYPKTEGEARIEGVAAVVAGHTLLPEWRCLGNLCQIDTGAFLADQGEGALSLLTLDEVLATIFRRSADAMQEASLRP